MSAFTSSPPDEGFAEPMESQTMSESTVAVRDLPSYISQMSVRDRAQLAVHILNGLPGADFSRVVEAIRTRLHINFLHLLPQEICLKIFGFLDPDSLIKSAQCSQQWMALALDPHLWRRLYFMEGFRVIESEIRKFELEQANTALPRRPRSLGSAADGHTSKKRATGNYMRDQLNESSSDEASLFKSSKGKEPELSFPEDEEMPDAEQTEPSTQSSLFGNKQTTKTKWEEREFLTDYDAAAGPETGRCSQKHGKSHAFPDSGKPRPAAEIASYSELLQSPGKASKGSRLIQPALYLRDPNTGKLKLNWHCLYTRRRRLEINWETGKFTNFQLPHPDHPEEAHGECVYTLQYSGKYLVSGSRDTTLRIWNLETRRLLRAPLKGHTGSVLCLQFDADPEEDIIVSGSSDSNVIIWKFSTGEIVQQLHHAHRESVLNVRFDKRILVTCSKDNTIKIFNRRSIRSDDTSFPQDHSQKFDYVPKVLNNYGFNPAPAPGITWRPPYTLIGCLGSHVAAVNAVQILNNEIVSASGDRSVKVWDWPRGLCTRTLIGHNKGIACVQYDGRRIVSGSSDNEVKIFDSETGVEVASLRGHQNLVRTVQAGFGDLPYSIEEDQEDAKTTDQEYFKALESGLLSQATSNSKRRPKNAGSRKPEDITAYGAKLPPGGGGGKYGRIVSGSYDETVIIWRRDKSGIWKQQHTLRQEEAARAAARQARPRPLPTVARLTQDALDTFDMPSTRSATQSPNLPRLTPTATPDSGINITQNQAGPSTQAPPLPTASASTSIPGSSNQPNLPISAQYIHHFQTLLQTAISSGPDTLRTILDQHPILLLLPSLPTLLASLPSNGLRNEMRAIVSSARITNHVTLAHELSSLETRGGVEAMAQTVAHTTLALQIQQQQAARERITNSQSNARVFKLQFCARRIVCCSQMRVIVGWDFAGGGGDRGLEEACRFFAPIE